MNSDNDTRILAIDLAKTSGVWCDYVAPSGRHSFGTVKMTAQQVDEIRSVEAKLNEIASRDDRVAKLKTAPCVGDRLAETIVAVIDDPHRFARGRDVGCYVGLTPR